MMVHTCDPGAQGLRGSGGSSKQTSVGLVETGRQTGTQRQTDKEEGERRRKGEREGKTQRGDGEMETE